MCVSESVRNDGSLRETDRAGVIEMNECVLLVGPGDQIIRQGKNCGRISGPFWDSVGTSLIHDKR